MLRPCDKVEKEPKGEWNKHYCTNDCNSCGYAKEEKETIQLGDVYTLADSNKELICYERTERFAFLCPFKDITSTTESLEEGLELNIKDTLVYSLELQGDETDNLPISAIQTMIVAPEKEEK